MGRRTQSTLWGSQHTYPFTLPGVPASAVAGDPGEHEEIQSQDLFSNVRILKAYDSSPRETCFVSRKASIPSIPSSRPQPLCLTPPKGH